jgi:hypothetical protein
LWSEEKRFSTTKKVFLDFLFRGPSRLIILQPRAQHSELAVCVGDVSRARQVDFSFLLVTSRLGGTEYHDSVCTFHQGVNKHSAIAIEWKAKSTPRYPTSSLRLDARWCACLRRASTWIAKSRKKETEEIGYLGKGH